MPKDSPSFSSGVPKLEWQVKEWPWTWSIQLKMLKRYKVCKRIWISVKLVSSYFSSRASNVIHSCISPIIRWYLRGWHKNFQIWYSGAEKRRSRNSQRLEFLLARLPSIKRCRENSVFLRFFLPIHGVGFHWYLTKFESPFSKR